jgi:hypothetical protein
MDDADFKLPNVPLVAPSRDFSSICANFGMAIAANMPMIATTIMSSISVNPFVFERIIFFVSNIIPSQLYVLIRHKKTVTALPFP